MNNNVAIKIFDKKITAYNSGKGNGYVWVELEDFKLIEYVISLQKEIDRRGKDIIIAGDMSAKLYA